MNVLPPYTLNDAKMLNFIICFSLICLACKTIIPFDGFFALLIKSQIIKKK